MYTVSIIIIVFVTLCLSGIALSVILLSRKYVAKYAPKNIETNLTTNEEMTNEEKPESLIIEESSAEDISQSESEQTNVEDQYLPITFQNVMIAMRNLPEESDQINAYSGTDVLDDDSGTDQNSIGDCLSSFLEIVLEHDKFKDRKDELVNAFFQLYSFDYATHYEGADTFFEDTYNENQKEDVLLAGEWLKNNGFEELGYYITSGYESKEKTDAAETWLFAHQAEVYRVYRKIMFLFEEKYGAYFIE